MPVLQHTDPPPLTEEELAAYEAQQQAMLTPPPPPPPDNYIPGSTYIPPAPPPPDNYIPGSTYIPPAPPPQTVDPNAPPNYIPGSTYVPDYGQEPLGSPYNSSPSPPYPDPFLVWPGEGPGGGVGDPLRPPPSIPDAPPNFDPNRYAYGDMNAPPYPGMETLPWRRTYDMGQIFEPLVVASPYPGAQPQLIPEDEAYWINEAHGGEIFVSDTTRPAQTPSSAVWYAPYTAEKRRGDSVDPLSPFRPGPTPTYEAGHAYPDDQTTTLMQMQEGLAARGNALASDSWDFVPPPTRISELPQALDRTINTFNPNPRRSRYLQRGAQPSIEDRLRGLYGSNR